MKKIAIIGIGGVGGFVGGKLSEVSIPNYKKVYDELSQKLAGE